MKKIFYISFILIILHSCNSSNRTYSQETKASPRILDDAFNINSIKDRKYITFKHIDDIALKTSYKGAPYINQIITKGYNIYLISYFNKDSLLRIYNIRKKIKVNEVPIKKGYVSEFYYHNSDSIFIMYNQSYTKKDESIILVNEKGEIKDFLFLNKINIKNRKLQPSQIYMPGSYNVSQYENGKLFFQLIGKNNKKTYIGGKKFNLTSANFVGYEQISKKEFYELAKFDYPFLDKDIFYPRSYENVYSELIHNNKDVIISFGYSHLLYKYNYIASSFQKIKKFDSYFIDTISASMEKPSYSNAINRFAYSGIKYDKKFNRFFRTLSFPIQLNKYSIILADSNFSVVGEGIAPVENGYLTSLSRDTLLFINYAKTTEDKNNIWLSIYKMEYGKQKIEDISNILKKEYNDKYKKTVNAKITHYIKSIIKIKENTYSVIIIPTSMSCQGCVDATANFFSKNYKNLSANPSYLIISDKNTSHAEAVLNKFNLKIEFRNIFIDSTLNYLDYHPDNMSYNPRLVLVENGKIVKDKVYDAKEILDLQKDNAEFMKKHGFIRSYKKK